MRPFWRYYKKIIALGARGTIRFSNSYFWVIGAVIVWSILRLVGVEMEIPSNIPGGVMAAALFFIATWVTTFFIRVLFLSHFEIFTNAKKKINNLEQTLRRSNARIDELTSPPKIHLSIEGDGTSEDTDAQNVVTKRVQIVVRGLGGSSLIDCDALMEQIHRLDGTSYPMLEGALRCEWSNAAGNERFRKTIPDGIAQRVNLFSITRSEGKMIPLVEFPKEQLSVGIKLHGRYKICVAITADKSRTLKRSFLFEWTDYDNINLAFCEAPAPATHLILDDND